MAYYMIINVSAKRNINRFTHNINVHFVILSKNTGFHDRSPADLIQ